MTLSFCPRYHVLGRYYGASKKDRPSAIISALASLEAGHELKGAMDGAPLAEQRQALMGEVQDLVPEWAASEWAQAIAAPGRAKMRALPTVGGLTLSPYQVQAVHSLPAAGGVLGLDCGLGKTACALAAVAGTLGNRPELLVLAPKNAIPTWQRAFDTPSIRGLFGQVTIQSMDMAHRLIPRPFSEGAVIFDEAHMLAHEGARRTEAALKLRMCFRLGLALTGTMLHAGAQRILPLLDLAIPGASRFPNPWAFAVHFNCLETKTITKTVPSTGRPDDEAAPSTNTVTKTVHSIGRPSDEAAFCAYFAPFVVRLARTSEVVKQDINLPPLTTVSHQIGPRVPLADEISQAIYELRAESLMEVFHWLGAQNLELKLDALGDLMDDEPDAGPWVVFAKYVREHNSIGRIGEWLTARGKTYQVITGDSSIKERAGAQLAFQDGRLDVLLCQIDAGAVAMDLFRSCRSVALEHSWMPNNYDQAIGRIWRRGQTRPCVHYDITANAFQDLVVSRLRNSQAFDASCAEWLAAKELLSGVRG